MPKVGKTINFKYYAKDDLKPKTIEWNGTEIEAFPLYAAVSYGSSSTSFKVEIPLAPLEINTPLFVSKDLAQLQEPKIKERVERYSQSIIDLISKEAEIFDEYYRLPGFAKRLEYYNMSARQYIINCELIYFWGVVRPFDDEFHVLSDSQKLVETNLSYAYEFIRALVLWKDNQIKVSEWIFGDGKKNFQIFLEAYLTSTKKKNVIYNVKINNALFEIIDNMLFKKICPYML